MKISSISIRLYGIIILNVVLTSCTAGKYLNIPKVKVEVVVDESDFKFEKAILNSVGEYAYYECETIILEFSINPTDIVGFKTKFNTYDFSYECADSENKKFGKFKNLEKVLTKLKYSHFIIENKSGDFIIVDEKLGKEIIFLVENCLFKYKTKEISKLDHIYITNTLVCTSDLKIEPDDKSIRIYYYFKPNKKIDIDKDYKPTLFVSNWIDIDK
jgi:hypothetical protein